MTPKEYREQELKKFYDSQPSSLNENHEYITLPNGVKCEKVNMTTEEYVRKMGLHSYSDVKSRLGLDSI